MLVLATFLGQETRPALTGYGQLRGILAVAIAVVVFVGAPVLVLGTNVGFRKSSSIVLGALFGYLTIHGFLWMFYPRGPLVSHKVLGLPMSISSRVPAILLMAGAGTLMTILCVSLNRLDRPSSEEPPIRQ
jgi:hypothetical protein